jgi:hypothetical protein
VSGLRGLEGVGGVGGGEVVRNREWSGPVRVSEAEREEGKVSFVHIPLSSLFYKRT